MLCNDQIFAYGLLLTAFYDLLHVNGSWPKKGIGGVAPNHNGTLLCWVGGHAFVCQVGSAGRKQKAGEEQQAEHANLFFHSILHNEID